MKVILSPAMNMEQCKDDRLEKTIPIFSENACELVEKIKQINPFDLETELGISHKLLDKAFEYYLQFDTSNKSEVGTQALVAFQGLAYKNINTDDFTKEDFTFANEKIRILSSLYGVLKPTDLIQQYRLDFMCNFGKKKIDGKNLYEYWGNKVYEELFKDGEVVVGICSKEYEKLIKPYLQPWDKYIACEFLVNKNGKLKAQATASKMARGQMARYIVKNRIKELEDLRNFEFDGFVYSEHKSSTSIMAFVKK